MTKLRVKIRGRNFVITSEYTIVLAKRKYKQTQTAHLPSLVSDEKVKKK